MIRFRRYYAEQYRPHRPRPFRSMCANRRPSTEGLYPRQVAERPGDEGIFVWDGNYYALAVTEQLGVEESGGMVRVGIAHYNTIIQTGRTSTFI
jgi:hypothetical protein